MAQTSMARSALCCSSWSSGPTSLYRWLFGLWIWRLASSWRCHLRVPARDSDEAVVLVDLVMYVFASCSQCDSDGFSGCHTLAVVGSDRGAASAVAGERGVLIRCLVMVAGGSPSSASTYMWCLVLPQSSLPAGAQLHGLRCGVWAEAARSAAECGCGESTFPLESGRGWVGVGWDINRVGWREMVWGGVEGVRVWGREGRGGAKGL